MKFDCVYYWRHTQKAWGRVDFGGRLYFLDAYGLLKDVGAYPQMGNRGIGPPTLPPIELDDSTCIKGKS